MVFSRNRSSACLTRPEAVTTLDFRHLLVCIAVESAHASLEASRADGPRLPYAERLRIVQPGIHVPPRCHSQGPHARVLAIDTPRRGAGRTRPAATSAENPRHMDGPQ